MSNESVNGRCDGREKDGRWALGNRAALGNPNNRRIHALRKEILEAEGPEEVKSVIKSMRLAAVEGDAAAARVYLDFVIGRPPQAIELSDADGSPLAMDLTAIHQVILVALADQPEIRYRVAQALMNLRSSGNGRAGDIGDGA